MNIDVNYKNKKRYNTARYPIRQPKILTWLIWLLSRLTLPRVPWKVEKVNMEGLKPPYMMLSNHMYFVDFKLAAMGTGSHRVNNVVTIDGYYRRPFLLEWIGAICHRKYTMDLHLIKSIAKVLRRGDVLSMYPEARYTPCGVLEYMPESLGKLVKMNKVPVVTVVHHGNHIHSPFWDFRHKRKVPLHTVMTLTLTPEQIQNMTVDEINAHLRQALDYDEYKYVKDNGIRVTEPFRAQGMHKVLYQCPHCGAEHKMNSAGTELFCEACGKRWTLNEDMTLTAQSGETEFSHVPDWYKWEKAQVEQQIADGTYSFEDEVEVFSMPRCWKFEKLGMARVRHTIENGWELWGHYRGEDYYIHRKPHQQNALHVEYDFQYIKPLDCFDISPENDSFYCYPQTRENVLTKLAFATEIIHLRNREKVNA
ncbi:MAG: hypothetical protein IJO42_04430 [Clostridia bacterium]|nr:hypothetical protein [Clostridia bacterium]